MLCVLAGRGGGRGRVLGTGTGTGTEAISISGYLQAWNAAGGDCCKVFIYTHVACAAGGETTTSRTMAGGGRGGGQELGNVSLPTSPALSFVCLFVYLSFALFRVLAIYARLLN